jgi:hypothetical protein
MGIPDEIDCEINTQLESYISSKLSSNLHKQEEEHNKNGLKKLMVQQTASKFS